MKLDKQFQGLFSEVIVWDHVKGQGQVLLRRVQLQVRAQLRRVGGWWLAPAVRLLAPVIRLLAPVIRLHAPVVRLLASVVQLLAQ